MLAKGMESSFLWTALGCSFHIFFTSGLRVTPNVTELILTKGATIELTCVNDHYPVNWTYPQYSPDVIFYDEDACRRSNLTIYYTQFSNGTYISRLHRNRACYMDTGYYSCNTTKKNKEQKESIYIYVQDEKHPIVDVPYSIDALDFNNVTIPCRPTSPNITVGFRMGYEGLVLKANRSYSLIKYFSYDKHLGFLLTGVRKQFSGSHTCFNKADSDYVTRFHLEVDPINATITNLTLNATRAYEAVAGSEVVLNCTVAFSQGDIVFIDWIFPNESLRNYTKASSYIPPGQYDYGTTFSKSLTVRNVTKAFEGVYTCQAHDRTYNSEVNTSYYLFISDPKFPYLHISVSDGALNKTVDAGERDFQWVVNVTSFPHAEVTWNLVRDKGVDSPDDMRKNKIFESDGRFHKVLIHEVSIADCGTYTLIANNGHETREIQLKLYVNDKPRIRIEMCDDTKLYLPNQNYTIEISVYGYPRPQIKWFAKNCSLGFSTCGNEEFKPLLPISYKIRNVSDCLTRTNLTISSDKTLLLSCRATNTHGQANVSIDFPLTDVIGGFAITSSPAIITVGDNVTLTCSASKYRYHDNFTWWFTSDTKLGQISLNVSGKGIHVSKISTVLSHSSILNISNVTKKFTGNYECRAYPINNTALAKTRETDIHVYDVLYPSWSLTNMQNGTTKTKTEEQVIFKCKVEGYPPPEIIWLKNNTRLHLPENDTRVSLRDNNQTLLFLHTMSSDEGKYKCIAFNKAGDISASEVLYLMDKHEENLNILFVVILCLVPAVVCSMCVVCLIGKVNLERAKRKGLEKIGLQNFEEGAMESFNPELDITDQADLLPYDRRWEFPASNLRFGKQLGSGAFGVVLKAEADGIVEENTRTTVAVKMVKHGADPLHVRALVTELKIMIHIDRHENIVNLLGACTTDIYKRELFVIVEYCLYGNLRDYLLKHRRNFINQINDKGELDMSITHSNKMNWSSNVMNYNFSANSTNCSIASTTDETPISADGYLLSKDSTDSGSYFNYVGDYLDMTGADTLNTTDLINWSLQITCGMEYLASRKVLHGDLAARNVLLADNRIAKICDFGLAKSVYSNENYQRNKSTLLPVRWMALESIRDRVFSIRSDVWSFGITMWELFSLSVTPYPGIEQLETLLTKLTGGYRLERPTYATPDIHLIMLDCWMEEPTNRPTFTELRRRLSALLEKNVKSVPFIQDDTNSDGMYLQMNGVKNGVSNYLTLLGPPEDLNTARKPSENIYPSSSCRKYENVALKDITTNTGNNGRTNEVLPAFANPGYL